jgi:hypothetical protein
LNPTPALKLTPKREKRMRFVIKPVNLALKEPCNECGNVMKCIDGCNGGRENYTKQKHYVQAVKDTFTLDTQGKCFDDYDEMDFTPLETFAQLFKFHLMLCNNDKQKARMLAKQQLAAQELGNQQEIADGWETVPSKKSKRGHGKWFR